MLNLDPSGALQAPRSVRLPHVAASVLIVVCGAVALGCGADGITTSAPQQQQDDNQDNQAPPEDIGPEVVSEIDTVVASSTITAGEPIDVDCQYLNPVGNPLEPDADVVDEEVVLTHPDDAVVDNDGELLAVGAGTVDIACQNKQLGLTDMAPVQLTVEPGEAVVTRAEVDEHQIVAGDQVEASCVGFDEFDNRIEDADFQLAVDSGASGIDIDHGELSAEITTTGVFAFSCDLDDAGERHVDLVEVLPNKPAALYADPTPDQDIYTTGQVVTVGTLVEDRYGNPIPNAEIDYQSDGDPELLGQSRYRFYQEGVYLLSAEVTEETDGDEELLEEIEVVVNDTGPELNCVYPANGEMVDQSPDDPLTFEGVVADDFDVDEVTVDGNDVSVDPDGHFEASIDPEYGINYLELTATDEHDVQNVHVCSFMLSDTWASQWGDHDEAVSLQLDQDAVDDGNYQGSGADDLNSFNDLIQTVINSDGLRDELYDAIKDEEPFPMSDPCTYEIYIDDFDFVGDPHTTTLELMNGGLRLVGGDGDNSWDTDTLIHDIQIDLDIQYAGSWWCPDYSTTATVDWVSVDLEADVDMPFWGDNPDVTLGSVDVESGHISLDGWIGSAIETFAQGTLRDTVEDVVEDAISDQFDDLFDDLLGSVTSFSDSFSVPRLGGGSPIGLDFEVGLSDLTFAPEYAQFDLSATIDADYSFSDQPADASNSEGIIYPPPEDDFLAVPDNISFAGGGAHVVLLNEALHELWRAGLFHDDLSGAVSGVGGSIPDDAEITLEAGLPPMADFDDKGDTELMLGAIRLELVYPGIFDEPISFDVGAVASTDVDIETGFSGDSVEFEDIELQELYFSTQEITINPETYNVLEDLFTTLLEDVIDSSVNSALPSIPIPSFEIPSSMYPYDLPAGSLGLVDADLDQSDTHLELTGEFGIQ